MVLWILTIASLIGVVMNIKKRRECFYIWAVTNASWTAVDYYHGLYAQSALFGVYFCLAVYGAWEWRNHGIR